MSTPQTQKKSEQLGEPFGTASAKLRKQLLFKYVSKSGECVCCRCNTKIECISEFSIDHKEPWLDSENPTDLFFSDANISFAHLTCNIKAARRTQQKYFTEESKREAEAIHRKNSYLRHRDRIVAERRAKRAALKLENKETHNG